MSHRGLVDVPDDEDGDVGVVAQPAQVPVVAGLLHQRGVEERGQVLPLPPQGHVLDGEPAEALLQVLNAGQRRRVLLVAVDEEEHQADNDEGLDERREEEDDAHVVAAALALGVVLHLLLHRGAALLGVGVAAAVHAGWRSVREKRTDDKIHQRISTTAHLQPSPSSFVLTVKLKNQGRTSFSGGPPPVVSSASKIDQISSFANEASVYKLLWTHTSHGRK